MENKFTKGDIAIACVTVSNELLQNAVRNMASDEQVRAVANLSHVFSQELMKKLEKEQADELPIQR